MKKILSTIIALFIFWKYWVIIAAETLTLSAVVGNSNHAPVVISVSPDFSPNPNYLPLSTDTVISKQAYTVLFRDDENDEVNYTVTTETNWWTVTISSWNITDYTNNEAYIFFDYIAPTSWIWPKTITVTISDWPNITIKEIYVYLY